MLLAPELALFQHDFQEEEPATREEDPAHFGQALVADEGEPAEEPAAAAAVANLKWPEKRSDEVIVEEMKRFIVANGERFSAGVHQQPLRERPQGHPGCFAVVCCLMTRSAGL